MPRTRPVVLAGLLVVAGLLVTGCSDPAPSDGPSPTAGSAAPSASGTSTAGTTAPATPSGSATSAAPGPTTSSEPGVEPSRTVETAPAKKLDEPSRTGGAEVSLVSVRATSITSKGAGDSGAGVLVRVAVRNTTGKALDTSFVQVSTTNAAGDPGSLVSGDPTRYLPDSLGPRARGEGTYAFVLDGATSGPVTVAVFVNQDQPVVQFRGRAS